MLIKNIQELMQVLGGMDSTEQGYVIGGMALGYADSAAVRWTGDRILTAGWEVVEIGMEVGAESKLSITVEIQSVDGLKTMETLKITQGKAGHYVVHTPDPAEKGGFAND